MVRKDPVGKKSFRAYRVFSMLIRLTFLRQQIANLL